MTPWAKYCAGCGAKAAGRSTSEATGGVLEGGGRPDVLVLEASGWPVVIEAELAHHASAETDAIARLGRKPSGSVHEIETGDRPRLPTRVSAHAGRTAARGDP